MTAMVWRACLLTTNDEHLFTGEAWALCVGVMGWMNGSFCYAVPEVAYRMGIPGAKRKGFAGLYG